DKLVTGVQTCALPILAPSCSHVTEFATIATRSSGVMARFVGGPKIEFISGKLMTTLGDSGLEMSTTEMESWPGATNLRLPSASRSEERRVGKECRVRR